MLYNYSLLFWELCFFTVSSVLCCTNANFDEVQFIFVRWLSELLVSYQISHCQIQGHEGLPYLFSSKRFSFIFHLGL